MVRRCPLREPRSPRCSGPPRPACSRAFEPRDDEVALHADALAAAYNEPYNRAMMGQAEMSAAEVREHYAAMAAAGNRPFLLTCDGRLMGDADLRRIEATQAEFAILIGGRESQGRGLGTRFALMLHAFAFRALALQRLYITIVHDNRASHRMFEKVGYRLDHSDAIRAHVDHPTDLAYSIDRETFERLHAPALREIAVQPR